MYRRRNTPSASLYSSPRLLSILFFLPFLLLLTFSQWTIAYRAWAEEASLNHNAEPRLLTSEEVKPFLIFNSNITAVKKVLYVRYDSFEDLTYSPQGTYLASSHHDSRITASREGGYNGGINLWSPETLEHVGTLSGHKFNAQEIEFTPDERFLISTGEDQTIRVWDVSDKREILKIQDVPRFYYTVRVLPGGDAFLVGGSDKIDNLLGSMIRSARGSQHYLQLRNLKTGEIIRRYLGHKDTVNHITLTQDGTGFITSSLDGSVRLWTVNSDKPVKLLFETGGLYMWGLSYFGDNHSIAFGFEEQVKLMDVSTGKILESFAGPSDEVEFIGAGKYVVAHSPGRFVIWDIRSKVRVLDVHRDNVGGFVGAHAVSPDGKTLALGFTEDKTRTQRIILLDISKAYEE